MEASQKKSLEDQAIKGSPSYQTSLNLQAVPYQDISILDTKIDTLWPTTLPSESGILEFYLPPSTNYYTSLKDTLLYLKVKIVDKDGKALPSISVTCPANLPFGTLFSNLELVVNNVNVTNSSNMYAYSTFINRVLNSSQEDHDTLLKCEHYYDQTTETAVDPLNKGYQALLKLQKNGEFEIVSRIAHGLFEMDRLVPPEIGLRIRLRLASPTFCLLGKEPAENTTFTDTFKITEASLEVKRNLVHTRVAQMHESLWSKGQPFVFPYTNYDAISYTVPSGLLQHQSETLFNVLPQFLLIGMVKSTAFNGVANLSPFQFSDFSLSGVQLQCNGESVLFPHLQLSVTNKQYLKVYRHLTGLKNANGQSPCIGLNEFLKLGLFLIPLKFNNSKELRFNIEKNGAVKVNLSFSTATESNINVVVYHCNSRLLKVDKNNVFLS